MAISEKMQVTDKKKIVQLWISRDFYIPVDERGYCAGLCAEGALGFVIQIHRYDEKQRRALKVPKLLGDTPRENAYIDELLEKEMRTVIDVDQGGRGLLQAFQVNGSPLRGPISTTGGNEESIKWNDALLFVRFEKGMLPKFCLVSPDGKRHLPESANCPIDSQEALNKIRDASTGARPWSRTVFVDQRHNSGNDQSPLTVYSAAHALNANPSRSAWYTSIPSIIYSWADGTLQESLSLGDRVKSWDIKQHLKLTENLLHGVKKLHSNRQLHADLRPANILHLGSPGNPDDYFIADYGSFSETGGGPPQHDTSIEGTTGPTIVGERSSAFYAPERRQGNERESADTVVMINSAGSGASTDIFLILGWKSRLIDPDTKRPIKSLDGWFKSGELVSSEVATIEESTLVEGDRVQIRDYIFEIKKEWHTADGMQILKCAAEFWKISHNRIVVKCEEAFDRIQWFPIPRTIELYQWSASTDLYSIGALALYSVYKGSLHRQRFNTLGVEATSKTVPSLEHASSKSDEDFPGDVGVAGQRSLFQNDLAGS